MVIRLITDAVFLLVVLDAFTTGLRGRWLMRYLLLGLSGDHFSWLGCCGICIRSIVLDHAIWSLCGYFRYREIVQSLVGSVLLEHFLGGLETDHTVLS